MLATYTCFSQLPVLLFLLTYTTFIYSSIICQGVRKKDPVLKITSDYLIHAPDIVYQLLSLCLKSYVIHAHVSDFLLVSMLIPLIKNKMGDMTDNNNYRQA